MSKEKQHYELAIIGGGPGGYTAAFRAADLGKSVVLIEEQERLGGVCLNVGCIPSKTLLHAAEIIEEAVEAGAYGLQFPAPKINLDTLRHKKEAVIDRLTGGLKTLAKIRKVSVIQGKGSFVGAQEIVVEKSNGRSNLTFDHCIIAVGSRPVELPFLPQEDPRLWDSSTALEIPFVPKHLAVLGGGIIGLEMAQVYAALGSKISIIEMLDHIIPPADADLVQILEKKLRKKYQAIYTKTKLSAVNAKKNTLQIILEGPDAPPSIDADALLVAVGRRPNGASIAAEKAGLQVDEKGFIKVNKKQETAVPGIYAIGDVVGNPMLAHKAVHEAKVAAEVIAGHKSAFSALAIPSVAYTNPEIAWTGYTEKQAKAEGLAYEKGVFPWNASGRALTTDKEEGLTKVLFHPETGRLIGAGITGNRAGDLIAEATVSIEMGADARDISASIHPHPTFAETIAFAAEMAEGTITDMLPAKKKKPPSQTS